MTENRKYTDAVDAGAFADLGSEVPLDDVFKDPRGEIRNILLAPITSVARIGSRAGTVRANHWHKTDWHYALVEFGAVAYFEREIGSTEVPEPTIFRAGKMFFTPPGREHAMLFLEDSVIYTFAKNRRTHEEHEADLVRVPFITDAIVRKYVP